ncbi:MAG: hypothetical protein ABW166_05645 [Sedimenticola sp.]
MVDYDTSPLDLMIYSVAVLIGLITVLTSAFAGYQLAPGFWGVFGGLLIGIVLGGFIYYLIESLTLTFIYMLIATSVIYFCIKVVELVTG